MSEAARAAPIPASGSSGRRPMPAGLREKDLARLWEGGTVPAAALITEDGTPLQVVYRGRPNGGAGPDFRDAVIALPDGRFLHGDVELHLRASDFRRHGHDQDRAYNRVILHLVYHADAGGTTSLRNGRRVPVVALERWLAARAAALQAMIEQPALWREPCQGAVERMGEDEVARTLARLGERRLRIKAAEVAGRSPVAALYERLLRTLGHGRQRPAWVELSRRVPIALLAAATELQSAPPERALEALLLGAAGLLGPHEVAEEAEGPSAYLEQSRQLWHLQGAPHGPRIGTGGPRRPANHPARRLAGLARLLAGGPELLLARLRASLLSERQPALPLVRALTVPADGLWRERHVPWAAPAPGGAPALIGPTKALELVLNAALPVLLAVAEREGDREAVTAALQAFHGLPSPPPYGRTAHLYRALQREGSVLMRRADHGQAALHLYAHYCTRGSCGRCPLS